ncbi:MAG: hypothetical protein J2P24_04580 [Streptosporangiales bacterium]|nr:hypothetical protein [Streptosporangiales bacterium]
MNFLLLLYGDEAAEDALPVAEKRRIVDGHEEFGDALRDEGAYVYATALDESAPARTVRDDVVADGPFARGGCRKSRPHRRGAPAPRYPAEQGECDGRAGRVRAGDLVGDPGP